MCALKSAIAASTAILLLAGTISMTLSAGELASASYRQLGGNLNASSARTLASASFDAGGSLGQSAAVGFAAAAAALDTSAGGFWPIAEGSLPSLDADGDGIAAFLDPDDDNDGLLDDVETGTGVFVSAADTGTNPNAADSDGDGLDDGAEVAGGTDPNDPLSPSGVPVPWGSPFGRVALVLLLAVAGAWRLRAASRTPV